MVMNSIEEDALLGPRRASSTLKKGMFLRQERRFLEARRACAVFKTYEKDLHQSHAVFYYTNLNSSFLPILFLHSDTFHIMC
jgi:hypothetical protein